MKSVFSEKEGKLVVGVPSSPNLYDPRFTDFSQHSKDVFNVIYLAYCVLVVEDKEECFSGNILANCKNAVIWTQFLQCQFMY